MPKYVFLFQYLHHLQYVFTERSVENLWRHVKNGWELGQAGLGMAGLGWVELGPHYEDDCHGFFAVNLTKLRTKERQLHKMKTVLRIRDPVPFWLLDPGSGIGWTKSSQKSLSRWKWFMLLSWDCIIKLFLTNLPDLQFLTADRMSLITPSNSNGWTIPLKSR